MKKKSTREARRREALEALASICAMAHMVRENDTRLIHVTVWLDPSRRIDWWPTTQKWTAPNGRKVEHTGTALEFVAYLADQNRRMRNGPKPIAA